MMRILVFFMLTGTLINGQRCQHNYVAQHLQINDEQREALQGNCERCMIEHDVAQEELTAIENGETSDPSNNAMCYFGCYYMAAGTVNEQNEVNYTELKNYMSAETIRAVEKCEHVMDGKEHCRASYELYACFIRALKH